MYILNTSVIIEILRQNQSIFQRFDRIVTSGINVFTITLAYYEIQRGIVYANATAQKRRLTSLLQRITMLGVDDERILDTAADIHSDLRRNGQTVQDIDIFIMAVALIRDFTVITTDSDFLRASGFIPNLRVEQW